jgi:hypothetical protein
MKIDCYLSPECASEERLRKNIEEALQLAGLKADLKITRLSQGEARELRVKGSPAIYVNGCNMFPLEGEIGFS